MNISFLEETTFLNYIDLLNETLTSYLSTLIFFLLSVTSLSLSSLGSVCVSLLIEIWSRIFLCLGCEIFPYAFCHLTCFWSACASFWTSSVERWKNVSHCHC